MFLFLNGILFLADLLVEIFLNIAYLFMEVDVLVLGSGINKEGVLKEKKKYFLMIRVLNFFFIIK